MQNHRQIREWSIQMTSETNRVLRRSHSKRMIAGVAGGLSEFTGISAFWFRLAFIIALLPGGIPGITAYLILWIVIPSE
jgi:phage shock protein PspC (stress-responsive transcriptional regulator)